MRGGSCAGRGELTVTQSGENLGGWPSRKRVRLSGAILAGGRASRYGGRPKGLLPLAGGETLLARTIGELRAAGLDDIVVIANDRKTYARFGHPVVPDLRPGLGPLGGIEAALNHLAPRCDGVLLLPCDLPGITAAEIAALRRAFLSVPAPVVMAETERQRCHPLCAVVDVSIGHAVSQAIDAGRRSPYRLWLALGAALVHFQQAAPFFNLNTPEDLARWRRANPSGRAGASTAVETASRVRR